MTAPYTAAEYRALAQSYQVGADEAADDWEMALIASALRIAARVMEPGVMERAMTAAMHPRGSDQQCQWCNDNTAAIRSALTGDAE